MTDQIETIFEKYLSFNPKETDMFVEDIQLRNWMLNVMDICRSANSFEDAIQNIATRKYEYSKSIGFHDELPYSSLLLSYVYFKWGKYSDAAEKAQNAVDEFKACGKTCNQAIALWVHALALEIEKHIESAQKDIETALFLIERKLSDYKRFPRMNGRYKEFETIRDHLRKANDRLQRELRNNVSNLRSAPPPPPGNDSSGQIPPKPPLTPSIMAANPPKIEVNVPIDITLSNSIKATLSTEAESAKNGSANNTNTVLSEGSNIPRIRISPIRPEPLELEEISLPWLPLLIHPTAHANPLAQESYVIDGDSELPTEISHIRIENQICEIHLVKNNAKSKQHLARLISSRNYKWMKVTGDSMKDFTPKIENGDYALFYNLQFSSMEEIDYDLVYQDDTSSLYHQRSTLPNDNVVIVRQEDKLTNEVRLLIKSYKKSENMLYSFNDEKKYDPVLLCKECQIAGVVVAIAKPSQEQQKATSES